MSDKPITSNDLENLRESMVNELLQGMPKALYGYRLPTFDISSSTACCDDYCPCHSKCACEGVDGCGCNFKCGCHEYKSIAGDISVIEGLSQLTQQQLTSVLEVSSIINKLRSMRPIKEP